MTRSTKAALAFLTALASACAAPPRARDPQVSESPVVVFLLRHAEKATNDPKDPDLSEAGRARAAALAAQLEHAGVTHLFATQWKRTQQTLEPLAARRGLRIDRLQAETIAPQVAALRALPAGSVAVVAGHNDTIPAIARALGGALDDLLATPNGDCLPDYGRLYLLVLPPPGALSRAASRTLRMQYGEASAPSSPPH